MKQYTTEKGTEILFIQVPEHILKFDMMQCTPQVGHQLLISDDKSKYDDWGENSNPEYLHNVPNGYKLLGRLKDITKDQALQCLQLGCSYQDYLTPIESLNSLAASLNVKDNVVVLVKNK